MMGYGKNLTTICTPQKGDLSFASGTPRLLLGCMPGGSLRCLCVRTGLGATSWMPALLWSPSQIVAARR